MKTVSKWIASLLAIVMVLSLSSVPSFAASTTFYYDGPTVRCPNFQYTDGTNAAPALMQFEDDYGTTYQAYCLDRNTLVTPTFYENTDVSGLGNLFGSNSDIQINQIRKILSESYPITSVPDIAANAGLSADAITLQDVVAATQMAIWAVINSSGLPVSLSSDLTSPTTILYNYLMQNLGNGYSAADLQEVFTNGAISVSYDYISGLTNWSDAVAGPYVLTANNYYPALLQGYGFDLGGAAGVYIVDQNNNVLTQVQVGQPFFVRFDDLTACNTANITFSGSASFPSGVILMRGQNGAGTQPVVAINSETLPVSTFLNVKIDISQGGGDTGGGDTGGGDTGGGNQNTTQQVPVYSGAQTGWGGWVTNTATFPMYDKKVGNNSYNGVTRSGSSAWAMAIQFAGADKTVDLVVGQNTVAGSVTLHNAGGGKMTVTYNPFSPLSATDKNILTSINCGIYPTIAKIPNGNGQLMNAGGTITKNADGTTTVTLPYTGGTMYVASQSEVSVLTGYVEMTTTTQTQPPRVQSGPIAGASTQLTPLALSPTALAGWNAWTAANPNGAASAPTHPFPDVLPPVMDPAPSEAPTPPENITVTNATPTTCTLSWDPAPGAEGYNIYQILNGVPCWVGAVSAPSTTFTVRGLTPNSWGIPLYVSAYNELGEGALSGVVFVNTPDIP